MNVVHLQIQKTRWKQHGVPVKNVVCQFELLLMGKNKGRQSHSAAKQIMEKGTTSGSGKSNTSTTSSLASCLDVVQANQNAYNNSQNNLVGNVLKKKKGPRDEKNDDDSH